ncbi:hypothetical protein K438DRAFT_588369 [Mycena galopus ATCC 62051]|nr:hypothetical protein K438DRAFT_588369 [Mycena galopus ATCC 62051]
MSLVHVSPPLPSGYTHKVSFNTFENPVAPCSSRSRGTRATGARVAFCARTRAAARCWTEALAHGDELIVCDDATDPGVSVFPRPRVGDAWPGE